MINKNMIKKIKYIIATFLIYNSLFIITLLSEENITDRIKNYTLSNKINNIQICETESARKTLDMIMNGSFKSIVAPSAEGETNNYINNKQRFKLQKEFIFLMYIFYESENAWTIKINGDIYDSKNKNEITINNVAKIVTIGKNDIWFLLLDSSEEKVSQLQNLQLNKKTPYKSSYKIININKQSRILFRLFPGQIINTRTMLIEEF
jgi:hypothetical protein